MSIHDDFDKFLTTRSNGKQIRDACSMYKRAVDNCAYELNGRLKSGLVLEEPMLSLFNDLTLAICAKNLDELVLYRKTSDTEFVGPLIDAVRGDQLRYAAFFSTSGDIDKICNMAISSGTPLILEIKCPPGTYMAPIEAVQSTQEDEFLLGAGTQFSVAGISSVAVGGTSVASLQLTVVGSPTYAVSSKDSVFEF